MRYTFKVIAPIKGKSRPRFNRKTGTAYKARQDRVYEYLIQEAFEDVGGVMIDGYVKIKVDMYFKVTKEDRKPTPKNKERLKDKLTGVLRPAKKPDIDNVVKNVLDACNNYCYKDDTSVVELEARKLYTDEEEDFLVITVEEVKAS